MATIPINTSLNDDFDDADFLDFIKQRFRSSNPDSDKNLRILHDIIQSKSCNDYACSPIEAAGKKRCCLTQYECSRCGRLLNREMGEGATMKYLLGELL